MASSRRRRSISVLLFTEPIGFQKRSADMKRSSAGQAFVNLILGQKWKPGFRKTRNLARLSTQISLTVAGNTAVRANKSRQCQIGCDTFGFGGNRQTKRRFQKELRPSCRSHSLPALDKCSATSIILVASLVGSCHGRVGHLVAMNHSDNMR